MRGSPRVAAELAPAKVNLCLHVTGRRADGYHELDSIVAFAEVGDRLSVRGSAAASVLELCDDGMPRPDGGGVDAVPAGVGNLVWRALAMAGRRAGGLEGMTIRLDKQLPSGAGLGGGSGDAAAVLRAVARLTGLEPGALSGNAVTLGADVPMCLQPRPWRVRGIGERLDPVRLASDLPALLVWPGRPVATPAVFAARTGPFGAPVPEGAVAGLAADPLGTLAELRNDLTAAACAVEPAIADALSLAAALPGCRLARMSGSGSTVFALFSETAAADAAAVLLRQLRPHWWIRPTLLRAAASETALAGAEAPAAGG